GGGVWSGANTSCGANSCPHGACCLTGGSCEQRTPASCQASGGAYNGDGSNCGGYAVAAGNGTIIPGDTDVGNHCDDCLTTVNFPFPVTVYGTSYTSAQLSSNGNLTFGGAGNAAFTNACLPAVGFGGPAIMPHWDDMYSVNAG